jgi:hypothetical protein
MDDEDIFDTDGSIFAFANTVGRLCEVGDKLERKEFRDMCHDAALACLQRLIPPKPSGDLVVFHGTKQ